ncbi:MAG: hypothetical protein ACI4DN_10765 [Lachnospiraceae bacterium]
MRLQKVRDGECDGVVLAAAGLERLGLFEEADLEYHCFSPEEMVPAGGQGIIAIEGRSQDRLTALVRGIANEKAMLELETERRVLQLLEAGCHEALGVFSRVEKEEIVLEIIREAYGKVYRQKERTSVEKRLSLAEQLVSGLAREMERDQKR